MEILLSLRTIAITALTISVIVLPLLVQPAQTYAVSTSIPFSQIVTDVVQAPAGSAWIIMPDYNIYTSAGTLVRKSSSKCNAVAAMDTDIFSATYLFGALANAQNEVFDTNPTYVSQIVATCGQPLAIPASASIVIVAGPSVNQVGRYYIESTNQTVLYYDWNTNCLSRRDTGQAVACDSTSPTKDVLAVEAIRDSVGRPVYILWGKSYQGTFSGIEYLVEVILKNPSAYLNSWYVYTWNDASSGASANGIPDSGDSFTTPSSGFSPSPPDYSSAAWQYFALGNGINSVSLLPRGWIGGNVFTFWDLGMAIDGTIGGYKNGFITETQYQSRIGAILAFLETMPLGSDGGPYGIYYWDTGAPAGGDPWNGSDSGRLLNALAYLRRADPSFSNRIDNLLTGRLKTWLSMLTVLGTAGTCVYARDFELGLHQFRYLNSSYDKTAWLTNFYDAWVGGTRVTDAYGNSMPQMYQLNLGPIAIELLEKGDDYNNTLRYAQDMTAWAAKRYAATGMYSAWGTELHVKLADGSTPSSGEFLVAYVPNVGYKAWQIRPDTTGTLVDETSPSLASTSSSVDAVYALKVTFPTNSWVNSIFSRYTQSDLWTSYGFHDAAYERGGVDLTVNLHPNAVILLASAAT
jgi:hypothetical protein